MKTPAIALFAVLVIACGSAPSATGLSRDDAIRIARANVVQGAELVSADIVSSAPWEPAGQPAVPAWVIHFRGNFDWGCPATESGAASCPDLHSAIVVLDLYTGAFISTTYD